MKQIDQKNIAISPITNISWKKSFLGSDIKLNQDIVFKKGYNLQNQEDSLFQNEFKRYRKLSYESATQDFLNQSFNLIESPPQEKTKNFKFLSEFEKISQEKKKKCNCQKSNCLRLHCQCFKAQGMCSDQCGCTSCYNNEKYKDIRDFVLEKTKIISKASFQEKIVDIDNHRILRRGCKCKGNCTQKYCACHKNGLLCSTICQCNTCANNKIELSKEQVQKIFQYLPRKKYKISMNFDDDINGSNKELQSISFQGYRKNNKQNNCYLLKKN